MLKKLRILIFNIIPFLRETKGELKKVEWPSRSQSIKYTLIVIGSSLVVASLLGGLDFLFSFLINNILI